MSDYETPSARARRERLERIWPTAKPKTKRTRVKVDYPVVEKIPDEADIFDPTATAEPTLLDEPG